MDQGTGSHLMTNVTIVGDDGNPILHASITSEGKLRVL